MVGRLSHGAEEQVAFNQIAAREPVTARHARHALSRGRAGGLRSEARCVVAELLLEVDVGAGASVEDIVPHGCVG